MTNKTKALACFFALLTGITSLANANDKVSATAKYHDEATEKLFQNLKAIGDAGIHLFGVANTFDVSYKSQIHEYNGSTDCKDITGSHPAFIESDFEWYIHKEHKAEWATDAIREAYKQGIVVGYCYHLRGIKSNDFYAFKDNKKTADSTLLRDIVSNSDRKTNKALEWYLHRLDSVVIPTFKELGFPLIYRPFHEMTGGWFWWGTSCCTKEEFVKMYRLTVDYFRSNGVKNVLFAWSPDKSSDSTFYPGDEYVDIIGYDGYDVGLVDYNQIPAFVSNVAALADFAQKHNKIVAVTETGTGKLLEAPEYWTKNILESLNSDPIASKVSWIMTWYSADWNKDNKGVNYIPYKGIEEKPNGDKAIEDFKKFYNDPTTVFQADSLPLFETNNAELFIYPKNITLNVGKKFTLIGGEKKDWTNSQVSWTSSNPNIVKVDKKGNIEALKSGNTTITIKEGNKQAKSIVVVQ